MYTTHLKVDCILFEITLLYWSVVYTAWPSVHYYYNGSDYFFEDECTLGLWVLWCTLFYGVQYLANCQILTLHLNTAFGCDVVAVVYLLLFFLLFLCLYRNNGGF